MSDKNPPKTSAEVVVRTLEARGVEHAFGVPVQRSTRSSTRSWIPAFKRWSAATNRMPPSLPAASAA
ncbi:MAG: hypothetical protein WDN30_11090 [Pararobbsia sp.]